MTGVFFPGGECPLEAEVKAGSARVLFLSDHFGHQSGVIHGATRYFVTVLPRLRQKGIDLSVAFLRGEHPASGLLRDQGIEPIFFARGKWNPLTVLDIHRLIKRKNIQVIHCAGMKGIMTARIAGKLAGIPVIEHLHDCEPVTRSLRWPLRWTHRWTALTLAVSRDVARHAAKTLKVDTNRAEVLRNGVVVEELRQTPESAGPEFRHHYGILPEDKVIGIIGRLAEVKGHDTLIRAMPAVLAKEPTARLLIVGDGPQRPALNQRLHELGLMGHVTFTGQISNVGAALRAIDVVAMPSLREGLPYALLEAMALDRPVVASAVGGLAETINHCENGVLFRVGDAQALAKALLSVIGDADLKQTIVRGSRNTVQDFDITRHVDRLFTMYHALADGQPIPPAPVYQPVTVPWPVPAVPGSATPPVQVETGAGQQ